MPLNETRHYGCESLCLLGIPAKKVVIKHDEQLTDGIFMVFKDRDSKTFDGIDFKQGAKGKLTVVHGYGSSDFDNVVVGNVSNSTIVIGNNTFNFNGNVVSQTVLIGGNFSGEPSLEIEIRVPVRFPLIIDGGHATKYEVDTAGGNSELDLSDAAILKAGVVGLLEVDLSDSSYVEVDLVEGDVKADVSMSAGLLVNRIAPGGEVEIDASMSGSVTISEGEIDYLEVDASMSGTVNIGATVGEAGIDASMAGTVMVREITGSFELDKAKGATVVVHEGPHSAAGRRAGP